MTTLQRIYQIDQLLGTQRMATRSQLLARLGISWPTLKRDLAYMRDRLNAPIVFDHDLGGYRFEQDKPAVGPKYELPGQWFSAQEIHALLTMQHLLTDLDSGGLIGPQIKPLLARLSGLLGAADDPIEDVKKRIRVLMIGRRDANLTHFQTVGSAVVHRKRLLLRYHARGTNETTEREVSPQRLTHYRSNWYLDAWCHLREDIRAFAVDAITGAQILERRAKDISEKRLSDVLGAGYGIFNGEKLTWAVLRFTAEHARWVSSEQWHPQQQGRFLEDGRYELRVPYAHDREVLMEVLRHGDGCEVVGPERLRTRMLEMIGAMARQYGGG